MCTKVAKLFIDLFFWISYLSKISTCKRFNIHDLHCWIYSAGIHLYSAEIHCYGTKSRFTVLKLIYLLKEKCQDSHLQYWKRSEFVTGIYLFSTDQSSLQCLERIRIRFTVLRFIIEELAKIRNTHITRKSQNLLLRLIYF